jgi:hypothetical protein
VESGAFASELALPPSEECQRQVQRILQSVAFRNATTLQQLLQFLTVRALGGGDPEPLKEYIIGVEAFGRPHDFDPKTDTIVRVQIHRLRQKLKEYYESDGRRDPILVDIPKGHYLPRFEAMSASPSEIEADVSKREIPQEGHGVSRRTDEGQVGFVADGKNAGRRWTSFSRFLLAVAALIGVFASGILIGIKRKSVEMEGTSVHDYATGADPVKAFWANFISDDPTPVIAYPDAVFLLDNSNDLFRFRQGASDDRGALVDPHLARQFASNPKLVTEAGALFYENGYTGTGELQAVAMFSSLFGQMGIHPIIKPSRDITPVDLRQHNVILLGSTFQNVAVAQLMTAGDFSFRNPDLRLEQWRAEIVNTQPRAPEEATYHTERDSATHVLKADYGIVTFQTGMVSGRHIAILGGLDTTGTEGAAMLFTSRTGVEEVQKALASTGGPSQTAEMPQFQALVHVRLEKGYEVLGAALVTVHKIAPAGTPSPESGTTLARPR